MFLLESIRRANSSSYILALGNLNTPSLVRLTTAVLEVNCHPLPEPPLTKGLPFSVTLPEVDKANVYVPATSVDVEPTSMFEI